MLCCALVWLFCQVMLNLFFTDLDRAGTIISEAWEDGQALKDINSHLVCCYLSHYWLFSLLFCVTPVPAIYIILGMDHFRKCGSLMLLCVRLWFWILILLETLNGTYQSNLAIQLFLPDISFAVNEWFWLLVLVTFDHVVMMFSWWSVLGHHLVNMQECYIIWMLIVSYLWLSFMLIFGSIND